MKILYLVNIPPDINVWRRAVNFKSNIMNRSKRITVKLIDRRGSRSTDFLRFFKFLIDNRADILHIFEPFPPTFPLLYAMLKVSFRRPVIYDSGDMHFAVSRLSGDPLIRYLSLKSFELAAFRFSDIIIARGRGMEGVLRRYLRLNDKRIVWLPDGVDLNRFSPPRDPTDLKGNLGLEDKIIICYASNYRFTNVGRLKFARGWELIFASKKLAEMGYKNFVILMLGSGKGLELLKDMAMSLGVRDYIKFTGFVQWELYPRYLQASDICFYESINDISYCAMTGTKIKEYMACGKPIIAGKIGEAKYVLENAGVLIDPLNLDENDVPRYIDDVVSSIVTLLEDENLRRRLGSNARKMAEKYYDWNKITEKLYELYCEVKRS